SQPAASSAHTATDTGSGSAPAATAPTSGTDRTHPGSPPEGVPAGSPLARTGDTGTPVPPPASTGVPVRCTGDTQPGTPADPDGPRDTGAEGLAALARRGGPVRIPPPAPALALR